MDVYETWKDKVLMALHMHSYVLAISTQGWIQGDEKKYVTGVPFFKNFFRPEGYSNKRNATQWSRGMWDEVLLCLVPFQSQIFDMLI